MTDFQAGACAGGMAVSLFWWIIDRLREYLLRRFPDNPYWLHNRIKP
jgi:hypothetical protein